MGLPFLPKTSDLSSLISSDSSLDLLDIKTRSNCRTKIGSCFQLCYSVAAGVSPSSAEAESRSTRQQAFGQDYLDLQL